jgi:hypothetical protein
MEYLIFLEIWKEKVWGNNWKSANRFCSLVENNDTIIVIVDEKLKVLYRSSPSLALVDIQMKSLMRLYMKTTYIQIT